MPNFSNYDYNFLLKNCVCCDISEKKGPILFIFGPVVHHTRDLMLFKIYLGSEPKCSIYVHHLVVNDVSL